MTLYRENERIVIEYWDPGEGPGIVETLTYYDGSGHRTAYKKSNIIGRVLECVITAQKAFGFAEMSQKGVPAGVPTILGGSNDRARARVHHHGKW